MNTATFAPNIWYFPSAFGDIRLEQAEGSDETRVIWFKLTPREVEALQSLRKASTHWRRKWATKDAWSELAERQAFAVGERTEHHVVLKADVADVVPFLNRALNPERRTVHVVRIGQGKIEEVREDVFAQPADEQKALDAAKGTQPSVDEDSSDAPAKAERPKGATTPPAEPSTALAKKEPESKGTPAKTEVTKAATVKEPNRGCPVPDFAAITRRATRVLKAFLTPTQVTDFEKHQRFIVRGADTGHQYMLTSRNAPDEIARFGGRTVFDLNEGHALCVHDWDVPAEEELLALAVMLQLPNREGFVRTLPDAHLRPRHV